MSLFIMILGTICNGVFDNAKFAISVFHDVLVKLKQSYLVLPTFSGSSTGSVISSRCPPAVDLTR